MEKIEVEIHDEALTLWHRFRLALRFTVDADGMIHVCIPDTTNLEVHYSFNPPSLAHPRKLLVETLVKRKEEIVGLPRLVSARVEDGQVFRPEPRRGMGSSGGSSSGPLINEHERDNTLTAIVDSMIANPNASDKEIAAESHRIALDLGIKLGSVAAVRANFTRGRYGDPDTIIATRISWLRRNAPLRSRA